MHAQCDSSKSTFKSQSLSVVHGTHQTGTQFLCDTVARQPDISLTELKTELFETYNINVSLPTVMCSLKREGYMMKTVFLLPIYCLI
jgi:hypothetical protein